MSIPVFVISLKSSSDRRENTRIQLDLAGVKFIFVNAVDGRNFSDDDTRNNPQFGIFNSGIYSRYLRKEEIGCTLSHLNIFRQMIDNSIPIACILEDDNIYSADFRELLEIFEQNASDWDLLYLGHRSECTTKEAVGRRKKIPGPLDFYIGEPFEVPYGSHGYLITIVAAQLLLDNAYPVKVPVDVYLGNSASLGIRIMLLHPPSLVSDSRFTSTIQDENTVVVRNRVSGIIRNILKKNRVIFGFLNNCTIKFRILRNTAMRFLRKKGIIKNKYSTILK